MKKKGLTPAGFQSGRHLEMEYDATDDPYQQREKLSEHISVQRLRGGLPEGWWQWILPTANADKTQCPACR